ncbi:AraC family transcriptional regulator [Pseudomonas sp. GD03721]|nr:MULTISPECIES: AraC family transcriptional regulator [unclassified Pseudomonas]MDH1440509.1 AraC family transcriptional regulator [Pseudomonas sp. GD03722]WGG03405.1 AraC family transcriptional regulator [Pseudomonas sp. GD03721]WGG07573.1 AraC family transcriptional regulator [Pseudomonas sp. GD03919]
MFSISAGFVGQLVNMLEGEGLDSARLCQEAGVDLGCLAAQPDSFVFQGNVHKLMALAAEASANPDIGLRAYRHFLPGGFQLLGYTMMSSANLKQALESFVYFFPLLGDGFTPGLSSEGGGLRFWVAEDAEEGVIKSRGLEDAGIASVLGFCRWLAGASLPRLREIEFTYPEPASTVEHQRLFGCALRFGARRISILFDQQDLLRPLSTANEALALLHGRFAEHRIDQLRGTTYSERVRSVLIARLSLGVCDMGTVAMNLDIGKRTLQRELIREGSPFKDVLDGARRQLADYYLRQCLYSVDRCSDLLGFKEPSSLHKACLRWFGMPPGRYRDQLPRSLEPG